MLFRSISWLFGLIFGGKTRRVVGKGLWGTGMGTAEKPQGYPRQSLLLIHTILYYIIRFEGLVN